MSKDLRYFLDYMQRNFPDDIVRIKREVDAKWELSSVMQKLQSENRFPVMFFDKVKGFDMPVVANLFASHKLMACALETTVDKVTEEFSAATKNLIKPRMVDSGPVKDVILLGEEADLS